KQYVRKPTTFVILSGGSASRMRSTGAVERSLPDHHPHNRVPPLSPLSRESLPCFCRSAERSRRGKPEKWRFLTSSIHGKTSSARISPCPARSTATTPLSSSYKKTTALPAARTIPKVCV